MKFLKTLSCICLLALAAVLFASAPALAGAGPEPPASDSILPGEVWGVMVLICTLPTDVPDFALVRVKQVENCDVEVEVHVDPNWAGGCPILGGPVGLEESIENWRLDGYQFFDFEGTPYIHSFKNFKQITDTDGNTESTFDAKFKFVQ